MRVERKERSDGRVRAGYLLLSASYLAGEHFDLRVVDAQKLHDILLSKLADAGQSSDLRS